MLITFDTNRLGWPAPRRFYSTWRERSGDRTRVMPTVARELMPDLDVRRLARSVHETAARLGNGREEFEPFDRFLLERQVWWGRLFLDPDSQYEIVALTREQHRTALAIRNSLSASCFPRLRQREVPLDPDAAIIAEALATGYDLLITANMRSIDHWEVNEWVRRHHNGFGLRNRRILFDSDLAVLELHPGEAGIRELTMTTIAASWGDDRNADIETVDRDFRKYAEALEEADLAQSALRAFHRWEREPEPERLIEEIRRTLALRTRSAEGSLPEASSWNSGERFG